LLALSILLPFAALAANALDPDQTGTPEPVTESVPEKRSNQPRPASEASPVFFVVLQESRPWAP
jgi:hypothetical protein